MPEYAYFDLSLDQQLYDLQSAMRIDELSGLDSFGADTLVEVVMAEQEAGREGAPLVAGMVGDLQTVSAGLRIDGVPQVWNDAAVSGLGFGPPRSLWSMPERRIADPEEDRERIELLVGLGYLDAVALDDPRWRPEYNTLDARARRAYQEARFSGARAFGVPMTTPNDQIRRDAGGLTRAFGSVTETIDKYVSPVGRLEAMLLAQVVPDIGAWFDDDKSWWQKISGTVFPLLNIGLFAVGFGQAGIALRIAAGLARGTTATRVATGARTAFKLSVDDAVLQGRMVGAGRWGFRLGEKGAQARLDKMFGAGRFRAGTTADDVAEGLVGKGFLSNKLMARESEWLQKTGRALTRANVSAPSVALKGIGQATWVPGIAARAQLESGAIDEDDGMSVSMVRPIGSSVDWLRNRESWESNLVAFPLEIVMEPARMFRSGFIKGVTGRPAVWWQRQIAEGLGSKGETALSITQMGESIGSFSRRVTDPELVAPLEEAAAMVRQLEAEGRFTDAFLYSTQRVMPGRATEANHLEATAFLRGIAEEAGIETYARLVMKQMGVNDNDQARFLMFRGQVANQLRYVSEDDWESLARAKVFAASVSAKHFDEMLVTMKQKMVDAGPAALRKEIEAHNLFVEEARRVVFELAEPVNIAAGVRWHLLTKGPFRSHSQYVADERLMLEALLGDDSTRLADEAAKSVDLELQAQYEAETLGWDRPASPLDVGGEGVIVYHGTPVDDWEPHMNRMFVTHDPHYALSYADTATGWTTAAPEAREALAQKGLKVGDNAWLYVFRSRGTVEHQVGDAIDYEWLIDSQETFDDLELLGRVDADEMRRLSEQGVAKGRAKKAELQAEFAKAAEPHHKFMEMKRAELAERLAEQERTSEHAAYSSYWEDERYEIRAAWNDEVEQQAAEQGLVAVSRGDLEDKINELDRELDREFRRSIIRNLGPSQNQKVRELRFKQVEMPTPLGPKPERPAAPRREANYNVVNGLNVFDAPILSKLAPYDDYLAAVAEGDETLLESIREGLVTTMPVRPAPSQRPVLMDLSTPSRQDIELLGAEIRVLKNRRAFFAGLAEEHPAAMQELFNRSRGRFEEGPLQGAFTEASRVAAAVARKKPSDEVVAAQRAAGLPAKEVTKATIVEAVKTGLAARTITGAEVSEVVHKAGGVIGARQAQLVADVFNMEEIREAAGGVGGVAAALEETFTSKFIYDTDWYAYGMDVPRNVDQADDYLRALSARAALTGREIDPDTLPASLAPLKDRWKVAMTAEARHQSDAVGRFNEIGAMFEMAESQDNLGLFLSAESRRRRMRQVFETTKKVARGFTRRETDIVAALNRANRSNKIHLSWHRRTGVWMDEDLIADVDDDISRIMEESHKQGDWFMEDRWGDGNFAFIRNSQVGRLPKSPQDITRNSNRQAIARALRKGEIDKTMMKHIGDEPVALSRQYSTEEIAALFDGLREARDIGWEYRGLGTVFDKLSAQPMVRNQLLNMQSYDQKFSKELGRSEMARLAITAGSAGGSMLAAHQWGDGFDPSDPFSWDSLSVLASGVAGGVAGRSLSGRKLRQFYEQADPAAGLGSPPSWMGSGSRLINDDTAAAAGRFARSPGGLAVAGGVGGGLATEEGSVSGATRGAITGAVVGSGLGPANRQAGALGFFGKGQRTLGQRAADIDAAVYGRRAFDQWTKIDWNAWSYTGERVRSLIQYWRYTASPWFAAQQFAEAKMLKHLVQTGEILDDVPGGLRMSILPKWYERGIARGARKKGMGNDEATEYAKVVMDEHRAAFGAQMKGHRDFDYDVLEEGSRRFGDMSVFGYSVPEMEMTLFAQLRTAGMADDKAYDIAVKTYTYGVRPRGAVEQSINIVWFPASFQLKTARHGFEWLADDMRRTVLFHNAARLFQDAAERYDLERVFQERFPVINKLADLNIFASGLSVGVFGGEYRGFGRMMANLPFAEPVNKALTLFAGPVGITVDSAESWAEFQRDFQKLVPFYKQMEYLTKDAHQSFTALTNSRNGLTEQAEWKRGFTETWQMKTAFDQLLRRGYGEVDGLRAIRKDRYQTYAMAYDSALAKIREKYPAWAATAGQSAAQAIWRSNEAERLQNIATEQSDKEYADRSVEAQMGSLLFAFQEQVETYGNWFDVPVSVVRQFRELAAKFVNDGGPEAEVLYAQHFYRLMGPLFDVSVRPRR